MHTVNGTDQTPENLFYLFFDLCATECTFSVNKDYQHHKKEILTATTSPECHCYFGCIAFLWFLRFLLCHN